MTDANRIDVASIMLREPYSAQGFSGRYLQAENYRMAYEVDTNQMVVSPKSTGRIHVIPWSNINGFEVASPSQQQAAKAGPASPKERDTAAHAAGPSADARPSGNGTPGGTSDSLPAAAEVTGDGPRRPGGGTRRARAAQ